MLPSTHANKICQTEEWKKWGDEKQRREIEEMLGLRRLGLTETEMGDKGKDFVKGYTPSTLPHQFVAIESAIILKGFLRQFQIKGVGAYNHERCMEKAKPEFLRLMGKKSSEEGQTDRSRLKKLVSPLMWTRIMKRLMKTKSLACSWRRFRNWFKTSTRLGATGGFKVSLHLTCALRNSNCWVDRLTSNFFPRRRRLWSTSRMKKMRNAFGGTFSDTSPKLRKTLGEFQIWETKSKRFLRNWIPHEFERYRLI